MAGGFLTGLGFLLGAFATHLAHLYLSVGLLAGTGRGLLGHGAGGWAAG